MDQQQHVQAEEAQHYGLAAISACLSHITNDEYFDEAQTAMLKYTRHVMDGTYHCSTFEGMFKVVVTNGTWTAQEIEIVDAMPGFHAVYDEVDGELKEALDKIEPTKLF